jgi:hypothetical protein
MKIKDLSLTEVTLELKRAKFWVEQTPISKSLSLINQMENRKLLLIKNGLNGE